MKKMDQSLGKNVRTTPFDNERKRDCRLNNCSGMNNMRGCQGWV
jgi:hypothetical protein